MSITEARIFFGMFVMAILAVMVLTIKLANARRYSRPFTEHYGGVSDLSASVDWYYKQKGRAPDSVLRIIINVWEAEFVQEVLRSNNSPKSFRNLKEYFPPSADNSRRQLEKLYYMLWDRVVVGALSSITIFERAMDLLDNSPETGPARQAVIERAIELEGSWSEASELELRKHSLGENPTLRKKHLQKMMGFANNSVEMAAVIDAIKNTGGLHDLGIMAHRKMAEIMADEVGAIDT